MASTTTLAPVADMRHARRVERYKALRVLWRRSTLPSVKQCQHHSILPNGQIKVNVTPTPQGPRAGFTGLGTCGSVWACPVCSLKIATKRSDEFARAIRAWRLMGGKVALGTFTMRHERGQRLDELWDPLSDAWKAVTNNGWAEDQEQFGTPLERIVQSGRRKGETVIEPRIPVIRAVEATYGVNGWHLHIHTLMFLPGDGPVPYSDEGRLAALALSMFERWSARLVSNGLAAPLTWTKHRKDCERGCDKLVHGGLDVRWTDEDEGLDKYLSKNTYDGALRSAMEMARGGQKQAGGRAPFDFLRTVAEDIDNADNPVRQAVAERDLARWWEWEEASKGRRQITWSRGLRTLLGLDQEQTDEEIAAEDLTTSETVDHIHYVNYDWRVLRRDIPKILREAERWYTDEYLPAVEAIPDFAAQWAQSLGEFKTKEECAGIFSILVDERSRIN